MHPVKENQNYSTNEISIKHRILKKLLRSIKEWDYPVLHYCTNRIIDLRV